ncbi:hypothetical protein EW145_g2884 [Phellinidium pouzarii]|uniref:G-alpha-domain-containing protein n=1 Tax=Phellinidium pouzarii TaxID=167371 RepID=A0A4V3XD30_9AGAM|nr:hypothetical protein EW145_g2884 [Phellinidium pouzarii]
MSPTVDLQPTASRTMPNLRSRHDQSLWPPALDHPDESVEEKARRAALDHEARLTSERIDKDLSLEQSKIKKNSTVKILLLGQSESGKSTTLRNFQLSLAPRAFQADAESWRTVIHLNLLISVNYLLDILKSSLRSDSVPELLMPYPTNSTPSKQLIEREKAQLRCLDGTLGYPSSSALGSGRSSSSYSTELRRLMLSLMPLKSIETTLRQRLGAEQPPQHKSGPSSTSLAREAITNRTRALTPISFSAYKPPTEPFVRPASAQSHSSGSSGSIRSRVLGLRRHSISSSATSTTSSIYTPAPVDFSNAYGICEPSSSAMTREGRLARRSSKLHSLVDSFAVKVRGSTGWKRRARIPDYDGNRALPGRSADSEHISPRSSFDEMSEQDKRELLAARQIIQVFGEDIDRLWRHDDVQSLLKRLDIRLEGQSGFFLNDIMRVTAHDYVPTTADILRARLSTTGVEEHKLVLESGPEAGKEWTIYDVGGFRSQRAAWAPFFDSMNAIIFLAPISSFDEWLLEDPSVNRLEDTFHLWRTICANRLLSSVEFILFLNKYDVLRAKLKNGARFSDYVVNYNDDGGKLNDADSISKYMLATFNAAHKQMSPKPRKLRAYLTSVIVSLAIAFAEEKKLKDLLLCLQDSRATSKVVHHISEQVLIGHLSGVSVL